MDILLLLPDELIIHTLSFIDAHTLTCLFQLDEYKRYTKLQKMAAYAKYLDENIIISNNRIQGVTQLDLAQLQHLIRENIVIHPKEISFILFSANASCMRMFGNMLQKYFNHFKLFTSNFCLQFVLVKNGHVDQNITNLLFEPFNYTNSAIKRLVIKYSPATRFDCEQSITNLAELTTDELEVTGGILVENLKLHLFNSSNLLDHFTSSNMCLYCDSLKSLDLSFNTIDDATIQKVRFPHLLEYLNLSNNNLCCLNSSNFNLNELVNLQELDLCNNNIMKMSFRQSSYVYCLESVNLACNNIGTFDLNSSIFANLKQVNLSRNFLTKLPVFPKSLEVIDLTGNLLDQESIRLLPDSLKMRVRPQCGTYYTS